MLTSNALSCSLRKSASKRSHFETEERAKHEALSKHTANRSFNSAVKEKHKDIDLHKRERSQSYSEGKNDRFYHDVKPLIENECSGNCTSDDQSRIDDVISDNGKIGDTLVENVVKDGRYFLGKNLRRLSRDTDGSQNDTDGLDTDQLEWDEDFNSL